jgi:hypothetical protein
MTEIVRLVLSSAGLFCWGWAPAYAGELRTEEAWMGEAFVEGKVRVKVRRASRQSWTKAKTATFLTTLADTCNVVRAAKAAGVSASYAYRRRRTDAKFRSGWGAAVAEGYAKLELVLLDRALNGKIKVVRGRDGGKDARIREYSDTLALALLKRHQESAAEADYEPDADEVAEARERIIAKLGRLKERVRAETPFDFAQDERPFSVPETSVGE